VRVFVKEGDVGYGEERGSASLFDRIKKCRMHASDRAEIFNYSNFR
jgi:hypothetical protein